MLPLLFLLFNTSVLSTFERNHSTTVRAVAIRMWRTVSVVPALSLKPCRIPYVIRSRHDYSLAGAAMAALVGAAAGAAALGPGPRAKPPADGAAAVAAFTAHIAPSSNAVAASEARRPSFPAKVIAKSISSAAFVLIISTSLFASGLKDARTRC